MSASIESNTKHVLAFWILSSSTSLQPPCWGSGCDSLIRSSILTVNSTFPEHLGCWVTSEFCYRCLSDPACIHPCNLHHVHKLKVTLQQQFTFKNDLFLSMLGSLMLWEVHFVWWKTFLEHSHPSWWRWSFFLLTEALHQNYWNENNLSFIFWCHLKIFDYIFY